MTAPASAALVVDDDPICRELVTSFLRGCGWADVRQAADGRDAELQVAALGVDLGLVVTDINMPMLDGVEFLGWLADRGVRCPIVIVTGTPEAIAKATSRLAEARGLDLVGCLPKPVRLAPLAALVSPRAPSRQLSA